MKRVIWSTDVHLNFAEPAVLTEYLECLRDASPDAFLLGGDIAESESIVDYLSLLDDHLCCPIYFVLGNHDYYYGSIVQVRQAVRELCGRRRNLVFLTDDSVVELCSSVGLVGHDEEQLVRGRTWRQGLLQPQQLVDLEVLSIRERHVP